MDHPHAFAQCTALHFAAEMGHVDVISALCEAGADADARKSTGGTPLHTAADCDQPRAVASLLAPPCSASPNLLLNGDTTPLYLAAQRGFTRAAAALLDGGALLDFEMPNQVYSRPRMTPSPTRTRPQPRTPTPTRTPTRTRTDPNPNPNLNPNPNPNQPSRGQRPTGSP